MKAKKKRAKLSFMNFRDQTISIYYEKKAFWSEDLRTEVYK